MVKRVILCFPPSKLLRPAVAAASCPALPMPAPPTIYLLLRSTYLLPPLQTMTKEQKDELASAEKTLAWLQASRSGGTRRGQRWLSSRPAWQPGRLGACSCGSVPWHAAFALSKRAGVLTNSTPLPAVIVCLQEGKDIRFGDWTAADVAWLNSVNVSAPLGKGRAPSGRDL